MNLLLFTLSLLASTHALTVGPDVTVKNLRLFYGQEEFFVKGVCYSPAPLAKQIENQKDGTGYCTPHQFVVPGTFTQTENISPCFYDDFMDATSYTNGPTGGWSAMWERDFASIKSLGINVLRTYHAFPVTQQAINNDARYTNKNIQGASHVPFMDAAYSFGFKVLFPLFADAEDIDSLSVDVMQNYIRNLIDEVGYHPALLMYSFGNELAFWDKDKAYFDLVNSYIDYARNYQVQRWNRRIPVTTALVDYPLFYNQMASDLHVDVITPNSGYRGTTFTDLWTGSSQQLGWRKLSCSSGKPVLIGEMGARPVFDQSNWFPTMWQDMLNHKTQGAIGGIFYQWQEEHWKDVKTYDDVANWPSKPDVHMGLVTLTAGTGQYPVDTTVKKTDKAYSWNDAVTGFSIDVYATDGPNFLTTVLDNFCPSGSSTFTPTCSASTQPCGLVCYDPTQKCCLKGTVQDFSTCLATKTSSIARPSTVASTVAPLPTSTPIMTQVTVSVDDLGDVVTQQQLQQPATQSTTFARGSAAALLPTFLVLWAVLCL